MTPPQNSLESPQRSAELPSPTPQRPVTALVRTEKVGVLLMNVGTPDGPEPGPVRRYLREFLSDPRVMDMSPIGRWALLNFIILPFRPRESSKAYQQIWTPEGSPLLLISEEVRDLVQKQLGPGFVVEIGMRYGNPSIALGIEKLKARGASRFVLAPLYPQAASSTTGTATEAALKVLGSAWNVPPFTVLPPFYDHPGFINSFAEVASPVLESFQPDHLLFSFHGLPERHLHKADDSKSHCMSSPDCCLKPGPVSANCYRAQSFATARLLANQLEFPQDKTTVSFQSRLGRTVWIQPYTEDTLVELAKKGVKRLAVFSPAFVVDCLETLEELAIRGRESFIEAGGEDLVLVPSLNASSLWIDTLSEMLRSASAGTSLPVLPVLQGA